MTIKLEFVVNRCGGALDIRVFCEPTGPVDESESAYIAGLMEVVDAYNNGPGKSVPGCDCPACKANRKKKHERSDLH